MRLGREVEPGVCSWLEVNWWFSGFPGDVGRGRRACHGTLEGDCWSSEKVRTVDALAQIGEEGRGKLRKASGSCKRA